MNNVVPVILFSRHLVPESFPMIVEPLLAHNVFKVDKILSETSGCRALSMTGCSRDHLFKSSFFGLA